MISSNKDHVQVYKTDDQVENMPRPIRANLSRIEGHFRAIEKDAVENEKTGISGTEGSLRDDIPTLSFLSDSFGVDIFTRYANAFDVFRSGVAESGLHS